MGLVLDRFQFSESGFSTFYSTSLLDIINGVCSHELLNSLELEEPVTGYHPIGSNGYFPYFQISVGKKFLCGLHQSFTATMRISAWNWLFR